VGISTTTTSERRLLLNLIWCLAATDAALILLHVFTGISAVDLDQEANLTTWYSSVKLLGIAGMSAAVAARHSAANGRGMARLWLINAVVFLGLSADETASLHESFARWVLDLPALEALRSTLTRGDELKASYAWVWVFLPLILLATAFLTYLFLKSFRGQPGLSVLFGLGLVSLLSAVVLEGLVMTFPPLVEWGVEQTDRYLLLTTFEECGELVGSTLLMAAISIYYARAGAAGSTRSS